MAPKIVREYVDGAWRWVYDEGSGSQAGLVRCESTPFAYDTPGLVDGITVYAPAVGDLLIDAWIDVITAWNGTTPTADMSQFTGALAPHGLWYYSGAMPDLTVVRTVDQGGGPTIHAGGGGSDTNLARGGGGDRIPSTFVTDDPLLLVVSQDGAKGGASPGASQGSAIAHVLIVTPS